MLIILDLSFVEKFLLRVINSDFNGVLYFFENYIKDDQNGYSKFDILTLQEDDDDK
ncbi:hypothetical protein SAMN04487969_15111 [Paenibacillus algorifonticola]|uniref:Uncharacterized protein n=1 Tax=Paenibacillus algorifonticola TaxID=684063 RepID=A0A1I2J376_9BACL|nr:hypothetical protein SAMN04487969_15111 [Paenibacillus algorifonticola]